MDIFKLLLMVMIIMMVMVSGTCWLRNIVGGTKNSSFNGRTVNWQKLQRIKKRVSKKRANAKGKHQAVAVEGVSGKRTGKSQRKAERRERRKDRERAQQSGMDVDDGVGKTGGGEDDDVKEKKEKKKTMMRKKKNDVDAVPSGGEDVAMDGADLSN